MTLHVACRFAEYFRVFQQRRLGESVDEGGGYSCLFQDMYICRFVEYFSRKYVDKGGGGISGHVGL